MIHGTLKSFQTGRDSHRDGFKIAEMHQGRHDETSIQAVGRNRKRDGRRIGRTSGLGRLRRVSALVLAEHSMRISSS